MLITITIIITYHNQPSNLSVEFQGFINLG